MIHAIDTTCQDLRHNAKIRVVVLSGAGRGFCSGLDVSSVLLEQKQPFRNIETLLKRPETENVSTEKKISYSSLCNLVQRVSLGWRDLPVPVIASLHGVCFGGGLQIALGADIRLCSPTAKLSIMETKWGLIPDMGISVVLPELVRADVAKELTFSGRIVSGTEAAQLGLVTRVVDSYRDNNGRNSNGSSKSDQLEEGELVLKYAMTMARELITRSPDALSRAKRLYHYAYSSMGPLESDMNRVAHCLRLETDLQRELLVSWNQVAASSRAFGWKVPYKARSESQARDEDETKDITP